LRNLAPNKIQIILHQGLKRQIRIMLAHLGFKVQRLTRTRLGPLTLRGIKPGSYRDLREEDLASLRKAIAAPERKKFKPKEKLSSQQTKSHRKGTTGFTPSAVADAEGWAKPSGKPRKVSPTRARIRKNSRSI